MKKESDQPELPLAWPAPASRFRSYPEAAESNMPMHRFVKATKPVLPSSEATQSLTPPTAPFGHARPGMTTFEKK